MAHEEAGADGVEVPIEQALIEFYRQGATVSVGPVTIANSSSGTVSVFGLGAILAGDTVRVGIAGAELSVSSTNPVTLEITLSNSSGSSVTIVAGTRLINLTDPPSAYADELGAYEIGSTVNADSSGRAVVYLSDVCDYIVNGNPPIPDTYSSDTLTGVGPTLTVEHDATGNDRVVVVAVSWQESTSSETLDSVTYDDIPMSRLSSSGGMVDLFTIVNPPKGAKDVVVTWSGTSGKGAVVAVQGFTRANQTSTFGLYRFNSGSSTSPSVNVLQTRSTGLVVAALAANTVSGTATATPGADTTGLWNQVAGTAPAFTRTLGAGATKPGNGGTVVPAWTLSASRPWQVAGVEVVPAGTRIYADQTGAPCDVRPFGLNASNFPGLQEAIDALPSKGGVLFIPAGTYRLRKGLVIDKPNVSLVGEGELTVITADDPENLPIDLLTISALDSRISQMKFDGAASAMDLETGTCCIVVNGQGVSDHLVVLTRLEDVTITGASRFGLWLRDAITMMATNCNIFANRGTGLRIQGTATPLGTTAAVRFYSCNVSYNGSIGAHVGDPYPPTTGVIGITFFGCVFEGNEGDGYEDLEDIGTGITAIQIAKMEVLSCHFEVAPEGAEQFVLLSNAFTAVVDSCWFEGGAIMPTRAVTFLASEYCRFSSNSVENTATDIVKFDLSCHQSIEFANRDMSSDLIEGFPRMTIESRQVIGMSRGALGVTRHFDDTTRPDAGSSPQPGSLVWLDNVVEESQLQVWDGSAWRSIELT